MESWTHKPRVSRRPAATGSWERGLERSPLSASLSNNPAVTRFWALASRTRRAEIEVCCLRFPDAGSRPCQPCERGARPRAPPDTGSGR